MLSFNLGQKALKVCARHDAQNLEYYGDDDVVPLSQFMANCV